MEYEEALINSTPPRAKGFFLSGGFFDMRERLSLTLKKPKWKVKVIMVLMVEAYSIITTAYLPPCLYVSRPTGSMAMHRKQDKSNYNNNFIYIASIERGFRCSTSLRIER